MRLWHSRCGASGGLTVVADGLDNPRGIAFGPDGALYVAEAGSGGPGPQNCIPSPEGGAPACFGRTGAVTRITRHSQHRVLSGLLSAGENELPVGRPVRVSRDGSRRTLASEGLNAPGGFVLAHGAAYITNNSILSDAGQVVKVAI